LTTTRRHVGVVQAATDKCAVWRGERSPAPAQRSGDTMRPEVTGHVDFTRTNVTTGAITHYRYSVSAIMRDGTVSGEFEEHIDLPSGIMQDSHAMVTCVTIEADGRTARVGGVVDRATPALPEGTEGWLTVQDNGEGANDPPDRASAANAGMAGSAEFHCLTGFNRTLTPIEHGNIQVRP